LSRNGGEQERKKAKAKRANQPKFDLLLSLHFFLSASRRSGKEAFSDAGDEGLGLECGMNGWFD
jgi:hypothetical protein